MKKEMVRIVDCDTNKLYGSIPEAIKYLQEIHVKYPTAELEEHWYGYENMEMRFSYYEEETDEEYKSRCRWEKEELVRAQRKKKEEDQRRKDLAELKKLKQKLGIY